MKPKAAVPRPAHLHKDGIRSEPAPTRPGGQTGRIGATAPV